MIRISFLVFMLPTLCIFCVVDIRDNKRYALVPYHDYYADKQSYAHNTPGLCDCWTAESLGKHLVCIQELSAYCRFVLLVFQSNLVLDLSFFFLLPKYLFLTLISKIMMNALNTKFNLLMFGKNKLMISVVSFNAKKAIAPSSIGLIFSLSTVIFLSSLIFFIIFNLEINVNKKHDNNQDA